MIALDTNILVRLVTADDPDQHQHALKIMGAPAVGVSLTVLLETAWVLAFSYQLTPPVIADALRRFAGLPNVEVENPTALAQALVWYEAGLDFADALHLAVSSEAEALVTFDRKFAQRATALGARPPVRCADEPGPA